MCKRYYFLIALSAFLLFSFLFFGKRLNKGEVSDPKESSYTTQTLPLSVEEISDSSWLDGSLQAPSPHTMPTSSYPEVTSAMAEGRYDLPLETLKDKLHSASFQEQVEALFELSKLGVGAIDALAEVMTFLENKDPKVQELAAFTIAKMGPEAVFEAQTKLVELLKSPNPIVRENAIFALGQGNQLSRDVVFQMGETLDDPVAQVKISGLYALSRLGTAASAALPKVQKFLSSQDPRLREEAAFTMGRMGNEAIAFRAKLEELSEKDPNEKVRDAASNTLRIILGGKVHQEMKNSKAYTDEDK